MILESESPTKWHSLDTVPTEHTKQYKCQTYSTFIVNSLFNGWNDSHHTTVAPALALCHYRTHFPDSDPSFHLHFWHELTSWYKVWRIIIECIQGSRGVLLSGLNLMQSHLFNFTMREHPTGLGGRKQSDTERETLRLDRFNALATGISDGIKQQGGICTFVQGMWDQSVWYESVMTSADLYWGGRGCTEPWGWLTFSHITVTVRKGQW